jgi:hypothetical protein
LITRQDSYPDQVFTCTSSPSSSASAATSLIIRVGAGQCGRLPLDQLKGCLHHHIDASLNHLLGDLRYKLVQYCIKAQAKNTISIGLLRRFFSKQTLSCFQNRPADCNQSKHINVPATGEGLVYPTPELVIVGGPVILVKTKGNNHIIRLLTTFHIHCVLAETDLTDTSLYNMVC